jgi:hypothetical protein
LICSPTWSSQSDVSYGSADQHSEVSSGATTERSLVSSPAGTGPPPWAAPGWEEGDKRHNMSFTESASLSEVQVVHQYIVYMSLLSLFLQPGRGSVFFLLKNLFFPHPVSKMYKDAQVFSFSNTSSTFNCLSSHILIFSNWANL